MTLFALLLAATPVIDLPPLPAGDCLQGGFQQTRTLPALSRPLVMQGQLRLRGAHAFEWRITQPYAYGFLVEGESITETLPDGSVRSFDVSEAPWLAGMQKVFAALLAGNATAISEWFEIESHEQLADGATRLVLRPASEVVAQSVRALDIEYAEHLRSVVMHEDQDGTIEIRFEPLHACMDGS